MRGPGQYPPVWLALGAALAWAAGALWPLSVPGASLLGLALAVTGAALMLWAVSTMLRAGVTVDPTRPPTGLVTHGPFAWSRNPIYLADALILAGLCLIWQPVAGLVLVPLFVTIVTRRFIAREESWLIARRPDAFAAWAARTRRWL